MQRVIGFCFFQFFIITLFANIHISVAISCSGQQQEILSSTHAIIEKYVSGGYRVADSASFKDGIYSFETDNREMGFYRIMIPTVMRILPVIVVPQENIIEIAGNYDNYSNGTYICFSSTENQCYLQVKGAENDFGKAYGGLRKLKASIAGDRNRELEMNQLDSLMGMSLNEYNARLDNLRQRYPQSFCSNFIIPNMKLPSCSSQYQTPGNCNDQAFFRDHFLDSLNMSDKRMLSFPYFFEMIGIYTDNFIPSDTAVARHCLKTIFGRENISDEVRLFLFDNWLHRYAGDNNGPMVNILFSLNSNLVFDQGTITGRYALGLKGLLPGNIAPEIELPDSEGREISLSSFAAKHRLTVVLLYSHACEHCIRFIAPLKKTVDSLVASGLGVYAVDIEPDQAGWKKFIAENPLPFTQLFLTDKDRRLLDAYVLFSTPEVVLIDSNRKIITRFGDIPIIISAMSASR